MTNRQKLDASREARLWISTIITPIIGGLTVALATHPEMREKAKDKLYDLKHKAKQKYEIWKTEHEQKKEQQ